MHQQEGQRRQPLLTINNELRPRTRGRHDRTEKIRPVTSNVGSFMSLVVLVVETSSQVVDQLSNLGLLPAVLPLVVVKAILVVGKKLLNRPGGARYLPNVDITQNFLLYRPSTNRSHDSDMNNTFSDRRVSTDRGLRLQQQGIRRQPRLVSVLKCHLATLRDCG